MRRLLVAGIAALAVVLGLCTITAGAAYAVTPSMSADSDPVVPPADVVPVVVPPVVVPPVVVPPVVVPPVCVPTPANHHCGNGNGFPRGGHGYPGNWGGPRIDGRYLWLDQNLSLDVCSDTTYGGWYNRYSSHRDGFLRLLGGNPNARWMQLHSSSCGSGVSVSNDGQCVTYRQDALRYGNDLNTVRRDWSGLRLRLLSSHHGWNGSDLSLLSLGERNDWNRLSGLDRQRFDNYNRVYSQLRTVCNDPNPQVVILQAPAPVTYAAPVADPAPAAVAPSASDGASKPLASSPVPSGSVSTGGDLPAYVLAHARAV